MADEVDEQLELPNRPFDGLSSAGYLPRKQSDLDFAGREARRLGRAAAPHECTDPRNELRKRERLDEVVVRAAVQTGYTVLQRVARGQHQHRRLQPTGADGTKDFQAVAARQAEVEEDGVERFGI